MTSSADYNPFAAPVSLTEAPPDEAPDADYLITRSEILTRGSVNLPKCCLVTGDTHDLVVREKDYSATNFSRGLAAIPFAVMLIGGPWVAARVRVGSFLLPVVLVIIAILGIYALKNVSVGTKIRLTWYVSSRYARRARAVWWFGRILIMGLTGFSGGALLHSQLPTTTAMIGGAGLGLTAGFLLSLVLQCECRPEYRGQKLFGRYKGMHTFQGHSRKFTAAARTARRAF